MTVVMGIDIGGTGVKAALVETGTGELRSARLRIATPRPATPAAVLAVIGQQRDDLEWSGAIGCAFPGVVRAGTVYTAANLEPEWVGIDMAATIADQLGQPTAVINDADAAGIAEVRLGAPELEIGTTIICTIGTGIGTAIFTNGHLVPNTELGHLKLNGIEAEAVASARARDDLDLSWKKWSGRFAEFLEELERLLWPDRFVIGGGISNRPDKFDKFCRHIDLSTPVQPATFRNTAGIVGAALAATEITAGD